MDVVEPGRVGTAAEARQVGNDDPQLPCEALQERQRRFGPAGTVQEQQGGPQVRPQFPVVDRRTGDDELPTDEIHATSVHLTSPADFILVYTMGRYNAFSTI